MKIRQLGSIIDGTLFEKGDILQIVMENNGTKNVYYGKFICFAIKINFDYIFRGRVRNLLRMRHHTLCSEGVFNIEAETITKIEVIKKAEAKK